MIEFATFLFGSCIGLYVFYFISTFVQRLSFSVWQDYCQLFIIQSNIQIMPKSLLCEKKCGHILWYILTFGGLFFISSYRQETIEGLWWGCFISILIVIGILDYLYRLISPLFCVLLFLWCLLGVQFHFLSLTLEQSVTSAVVIFVIFYAITFFTQFVLKKAMLGEGDCWLVLALGSIMSWQELPLFIFLACVYGLSYGLVRFLRNTSNDSIPFAPFLILSAITLLLLQ